MPINTEGGYEDSHQKRERLQQELQSVMKDIQDFFAVSEKDYGEAAGSLNEVYSLEKKVDQLIRQEKDLEEKIKNQQTELTGIEKSEIDIDAKIDSSAAISSEINSTREKLSEIQDEIGLLLGKIAETIGRGQSQEGDYEGTLAIIEMKWAKYKEIKNELDELDE